VRVLVRNTAGRSFGMGYRSGRVYLDALSYLDPMPRGVSVRKGTVAGRHSWLLVPDGASEHPRMVWFHGGAYCYNSPRVYASWVGHLAAALGESILLPTYRLAPEHPYPAAHRDTLSVFEAIRGRVDRVVIGGDSAGAGLALAAGIAIRDAGEPAPVGLLLMSPWVDLTLSGESIRANDGKDAILQAKHLRRHTLSYVNGIDPGDPRISSINADLSGLPPTLIQCGADELFLSEGTELARRLEAAGTSAELEVFEDMWHDFQLHAGMMREAARATQLMADWARPLLAE
jgi:acetyl esterase/lipase